MQKLLPEQRRRVVLEHLLLRERLCPLARDPGRAPIRRRQQPHLPPRRRAVSRGPVVAVPRAHLPIDPLARAQRLAAIDHVDRLARGHFAAVPQIGFAFGQQVRAGRREHLVSRLPLAALGGLQQPAQARLGRIEPKGVAPVLTFQALHLQSPRSPHRRQGHEHQCEGKHACAVACHNSDWYPRVTPIDAKEEEASPMSAHSRQLAQFADVSRRG